MDQKLTEKQGVKTDFKIELDKLRKIKDQIGDNEYQKIVKELKLDEQNKLKDIDLTMDKAHKEEEA